MRINKFEFSSFDSESSPTGFASLDWSAEKEEIKALQISEEELAAREKAGFDMGYIQGREEGYQAAKTEEKENLNAINIAMNSVQAQLAASNQEFMKTLGTESQNALKLAAVIARKIVGEIPEEALSKIAEREVIKAVAMLSGAPKMMVTVSSMAADALSARLTEIKSRAGFDGEIIIISDETLPPQDVKITWQSGRIERTSDKLWHEIEKTLGVQIPPAPPQEKIEEIKAEEAPSQLAEMEVAVAEATPQPEEIIPNNSNNTENT